MTNSQPESPATSESPRVYLPGAGVLLFIVGPVLIVAGGAAGPLTSGDVEGVLIGAVLFWVGIAALMSALILEGVRSVAQQQLHILRKERELRD